MVSQSYGSKVKEANEVKMSESSRTVIHRIDVGTTNRIAEILILATSPAAREAANPSGKRTQTRIEHVVYAMVSGARTDDATLDRKVLIAGFYLDAKILGKRRRKRVLWNA